MTERGRLLVVGALALAAFGCLSSGLICPDGLDCVRPHGAMSTLIAGGNPVLLPFLAISFLAWALRLAWVMGRAGWEVHRLPLLNGLPASLAASVKRTGSARVSCLAADTPIAFCSGAVRPRIVISAGVVERLTGEELDAVLLHEREHARQWEPLVRAAWDAAAYVFFYLPVVSWWARRRMEDSELGADRAAFERLGQRPLAAALWRLGGSASIAGVAGFGEVADLRVAQVLGDPLPRRKPGMSLVTVSGVGLYLALQAASCLGQSAQHLF